VKLLLVFQSVDLQNLEIRKVTNSNIKVWVFENLDKSKKCRGPLVSLRRRLNGAGSLASRVRASCSATHRWPELHRGRPRAPPSASISPARLGSEAKLDFFTSPLHRSHRVLFALPPVVCLCSKRRPPPSHLQPPTRSVDAAPTTACVSTTFLSREPPTSTTGRHPSPSFPSDRDAPRGHRPLVSLILHR
jgi:hypothetical protein